MCPLPDFRDGGPLLNRTFREYPSGGGRSRRADRLEPSGDDPPEKAEGSPEHTERPTTGFLGMGAREVGNNRGQPRRRQASSGERRCCRDDVDGRSERAENFPTGIAREVPMVYRVTSYTVRKIPKVFRVTSYVNRKVPKVPRCRQKLTGKRRRTGKGGAEKKEGKMADLEDVTLDGKELQKLRVTDLKAALEERGLAKSGSKNALIKRLKG
eukprot:g36060.t1